MNDNFVLVVARCFSFTLGSVFLGVLGGLGG
jgi:hypothetical protein